MKSCLALPKQKKQKTFADKILQAKRGKLIYPYYLCKHNHWTCVARLHYTNTGNSPFERILNKRHAAATDFH